MGVNRDTGASTGSRASTEPVSRLGPSGFDPERFADIIAGCDSISYRLERCVADTFCEDLHQLETVHDRLVSEVANLVGMVRMALQASVTLTEGGDAKQAPGDSLSGAVPQGDAR